eukprot:364180-Chlamydomonas_euryale.AAC.22
MPRMGSMNALPTPSTPWLKVNDNVVAGSSFVTAPTSAMRDCERIVLTVSGTAVSRDKSDPANGPSGW